MNGFERCRLWESLPHVSSSCECWCWLLCMSPRLIFVLVLTSGAANNTAHIPGVDQRWRQLWNKFGRYFIYTHTLTVNYHNIHSSARCSAYEKYDIWWSLAASPGWRLCGVRLAQSVDENPQRIRRGAVSSEQPGAGFLHQQLFNLSRKQGGQQTKPSPGHEGEQSAVTTVDKYNLRPQLSSSVHTALWYGWNKNIM